MTREHFFNELLVDDIRASPNENEKIDIDKIVDTISLRIENKMKSELQKIYEKREVEKNDNFKNEQRIDETGDSKSYNEPVHGAS